MWFGKYEQLFLRHYNSHLRSISALNTYVRDASEMLVRSCQNTPGWKSHRKITAVFIVTTVNCRSKGKGKFFPLQARCGPEGG